MQKVSLIVITLNAETQLDACLASVGDLAAEIVVVDAGSKDQTLAIAARYDARVINQAFLGFGPQKRFAVRQASHDWVLCLDADESLTPALREAIRSELAAPKFGVYRFARRNRFLGRYLRHGEGYPDFNTRLFNRTKANWTDDPVHEHVVSTEVMGTLEGDLLHESAETLAGYLAKQNRYTDIQAEAMFKAGRLASCRHLLLSPLVRFFRFYIIRKGFMDGAAGFAHIAIGSFFSFVKYAKLLERWRAQEKTGANRS